MLKIKISFGLKVKIINHFIFLSFAFLICCGTISYNQMAIESPYELISLEDSLIKTDLSRKNQEALALAHKNIGLNKMIKKDFVSAKVHFSNVLNYSSDDSIAQYNLLLIDGHSLRKTGNKEKLWDAIELYYKASRMQPFNGEPYFFIGKSYLSLGDMDFDLILESYKKALKLQLSDELRKNIESEILLVSDRQKKLKDFWK